EEATFRNIGLTNVNISGSGYGNGGLLGFGAGIAIENAYVTGQVTGTAIITGGLVGETENTQINNSYVLGDVSRENHVGGLVGYATSTNITNVYATGAVSGTNYIGGLVGRAHKETLIRRTFATGKVTGNTDVGGVVGKVHNTIIKNTYATGPVKGNTNVAGLVGSSESLTITNTFASGKVTGNTNVGGLIGSDVETNIKASLWDTETTGQSQGIGKSDDNNGETSGATSADLRKQTTYAGWDFDDTWFMVDGQTRPFLRFEHSKTITNARQLQLMAMDLTLDYTLGADIDMQAALQASHTDNSTDRYSGMWGAAGFAPVGDFPNFFMGTLDGLGHEIKNLKINRPTATTAGLFGFTANANLQNITLRDATINGQNYVGGLVGLASETSFTNIKSHNINVTGTGTGNVGGLVGRASETKIDTSYAMGTVTSTGTGTDPGGTNAGGLVGWAFLSNITTSYATADVSSTSQTGEGKVGGLVGYATSTNIKNAYATGDVAASNKTVYIGGLVGKTNSVDTEDFIYEIENTYAMGKVTTSNGNSDKTHIGGLVGCNWASGDSECAGDTTEQTNKIINSFWNMTTTGRDESSRGASGKTNEEMDRLATFTGATWNISEKGGEDMVWRIYEGQAAPLLRAFMEKVQVTGTGPATREYDGTTHATISDLKFAEAVDGVTFASSGNGQYADANAGENKKIIVKYELDGATNLHTVLQRYDFITELTGTINKKTLTITADAASKTYGDTQTFDGTEFTADDLKNNETIGSVTLTSTGTDATADAGSYKITAAAATGGTFDVNNYTITYRDGTLTVVEQISGTPSGTVEEPENNSSVSTTPHAATHIRPETCVETFGLAPLLLNLPDLTEYCVDTSGGRLTQFTLVENSGIALPPASALLTLAVLRQ
ncbi:YDG domain-containing protein, partial [Paracoccaceae bacterium]|nr:YDG domain-containing protein [Paracoccaceae bacterium]